MFFGLAHFIALPGVALPVEHALTGVIGPLVGIGLVIATGLATLIDELLNLISCVHPGGSDRIEHAIGRLPEDLRVAVILRDVQGLSNQEAPDTLDVSVSALKARLHRGRLALRDSLASYVAERASSG